MSERINQHLNPLIGSNIRRLRKERHMKAVDVIAKLQCENINVTTDIDIRKIRKTKRIEVTRFMLEVLFTIIYFNLCRNSFPISNHPIVIKTVRNININTYIFISMPDGNKGTTAGSTTANTGFSS